MSSKDRKNMAPPGSRRRSSSGKKKGALAPPAPPEDHKHTSWSQGPGPMVRRGPTGRARNVSTGKDGLTAPAETKPPPALPVAIAPEVKKLMKNSALPSDVKGVLVGDPSTGKTCFKVMYEQGVFPVEYIPDVPNAYSLDVNYGDDRPVGKLGLFDTEGSSKAKADRAEALKGAHFILMCYSVVSHKSFENLKEVWVPEVQAAAPGVPFFVVGTMIDVRDDETQADELRGEGIRLVGTYEATEMAKSLGASGYFEVSAFKGLGLAAALSGAIQGALNVKAASGDCVLM